MREGLEDLSRKGVERDRGKVEGNRHPFAKSNWLMPRK